MHTNLLKTSRILPKHRRHWLTNFTVLLVKASFFITTMYVVSLYLTDDQLYCLQLVPLIKLRHYVKHTRINKFLPDFAVSYWFILSLSSWFSLSTVWILCSRWVNLCSMSPGSFKRILFSFFARWIGCARARINKQNVNILKILL